MTEDRKAEIVEAILSAYRETGIRPMAGTYLSRHDGRVCGCAVGVYAVHATATEGLPPDSDPVRVFCQSLGVDGNFAVAVELGFDGAALPDLIGLRDGHDVGRRVRIAVGLEAAS